VRYRYYVSQALLQNRKAEAGSLRSPSDPLTIQNDRDDRVVRGVQILVGAQLVSGRNSLLTGNFTTIGPFWRRIDCKNAAKLVSCRTIPYKMKQGNRTLGWI
jgi:hypothetical protein